MKKLLWCVLVCCLLCGLFSACGKSSDGKITVSSYDYPKLEKMVAGEFDETAISQRVTLQSPYLDYNCYVSVKDNTLQIDNRKNEHGAYLQQFDNGYFIGVNLGEFDGWVMYYPYFSAYPEAGESAIVCYENCCGIISVDRLHGYLLTNSYDEKTYKGVGNVYKLFYSEELNMWQWEKIYSQPCVVYNYWYSQADKLLYVVTNQNILSVSENGEVNTVVESELIKKMYATSIVYLNGTIYCGSPVGVYSYNPETDKEIWFPMDYGKYVK